MEAASKDPQIDAPSQSATLAVNGVTSDATTQNASVNDHEKQSNGSYETNKGEKQLNGDPEKNGSAVQPATESKPQAGGPPQVPDGGLQAWLQVLGAYMLFFNTW
jgi:hypothetical protein